MKEQLTDAIANMREDEAVELAGKMLDGGESPQTVLDACRDAMTVVGDRYEKGEYYLPELVVAGDILRAIGDLAKPHLQSAGSEGEEPLGTVIIGTVAGDIHDIGKDIVAFMLDANNFAVHDLGVDVPAEQFVGMIREVQPQVVALSGFLTLAYDSMRTTVEAIQEAGLREQVKIMIGGAPMDDGVKAYIGADAFGKDATAAVKLAKSWAGEG
jgi:methanogenic corrinoid protein MtbC1